MTMSSPTLGAVLCACVAIGWCLWQMRRLHSATVVNISALRSDIGRWQRAHSHEVESLNRRLVRVEENTATASNEVRMATAHLRALTESLVERIDAGDVVR